MCRICVAVGEADIEAAVKKVEQAAKRADVVEIRLDYLRNHDISRFSHVDSPLLFTNRAEWEGGLYSGSEDDRINLLCDAVSLGASYVDLEIRSSQESRQRMTECLAGSETKQIFSYHDFNKTPPLGELLDVLHVMKQEGGDIGKIITTAENWQDALKVLQLQQYAVDLAFPLIAFCMGDAGVVTRLATGKLGGYMTYCAPEGADGTASGQIRVDTMQEIFSLCNWR